MAQLDFSTPKVVALGGGHGLAATLSALRKLTHQITAIVTVADNGGSSGRLREEFDILPPGDLRMALTALCSDDDWGRSWAEILQYRFTSEGNLNQHTVGNLLLTALWDRDGDFVAGLDRVGSLLRVVGRVLPMASTPLDIEGTFQTSIGRIVVRGQKEVALAKGRLESIRIIPENPQARPEALSAIDSADFITMGPGSWLTSVLPHLMVPAQRDALAASKAKKIILLNLDAHPSAGGDEFAGYTPEEHLQLLNQYAPSLRFDFVIADQSGIRDLPNLEAVVEGYGGSLITADLRRAPGAIHHNIEKLSREFQSIFSSKQ
ncbi:MAG: gluconeogenesis factor YvcK family protein [Candidatus Nanopelagicaceae bacterium]